MSVNNFATLRDDDEVEEPEESKVEQMANWLTQMTLGTMQHAVSILLMEDILHQLIDTVVYPIDN